ncbi:CC0125/CC1285 family lipoprotein [uncultured Draconibacterium sp.]|uniref:CC0125/CC1285 family lipoprotein n=1 Tax=uncultured Draconibacterium sp. TaxID=1573823 RepID=UPI003217958D
MNRLILFFYFVLIGLLFSSCATHYNVSGFRGGYSEVKLNDGIYDVSFKGNGVTSEETIHRYFLYRCTEIALENNCRYFIMYDKDLGSVVSSTGMAGNIDSYGRVQMSANTVSKAYGNGTIKLLSEKPEEDIIVYDAKELKRSLEQYIKRGKNSFI